MIVTYHTGNVSPLEGLVAGPVTDIGQGKGGTTCVYPQSCKVLLQREKRSSQKCGKQPFSDFL